jgi:hypothetical protein
VKVVVCKLDASDSETDSSTRPGVDGPGYAFDPTDTFVVTLYDNVVGTGLGRGVAPGQYEGLLAQLNPKP